MPLRISKATPVRRRTQKKSPNLGMIFVVLLLILGGYTIWAQGSFKKESNNPGEAKKENIIQKTLKKEPPVPKITKEQTMTEIESTLLAVRGTFGYYVTNLETGESFGKNEDYSFTAASSIKVPFAIYTYSLIERGTLKPDTLWTYTSADYEGGTGNLIASAYGTKLTVARTVQLMLRISDNAATNILTRTLGRANIQAYFDRAAVTGMIVNKNKITPKAAATVLKGLYDGKYISKENSAIIIEHLKNSITPERIVAGVPDGVPVAHKIGTNTGAISDTAIVYHKKGAYVLTVYSEGAVGETEPNKVIADISKSVYKHFDSR